MSAKNNLKIKLKKEKRKKLSLSHNYLINLTFILHFQEIIFKYLYREEIWLVLFFSSVNSIAADTFIKIV